MAVEADTVIALAGAAVVLALFFVNMWLTVKKGQGSRLVARCMYGLALLVVGYNMRRYAGDSESTVLWAHVIALICIVVSFYKSERSPLTMPEE